MSVQSEIDRISGNVQATLTAVSDMGGTVPEDATSDDMAASVLTIPQGTSDYNALTNKPITRVESTDDENLVNLRDLESGTYVLYGRFKPFSGSDSTITFSSELLVFVVKKTATSSVQVLYPVNNCVQHLEITDTEYTRTNVYLNDLVSAINGTVTSENADYAEVGEWADGNPDGEDRIGYFVAVDLETAGTTMVKANSESDVRGVTVSAPAFSGGVSADRIDDSGNLLSQYNYVAVMGLVPVIDNGTCTINGRCMPADDGTAVPSTNSMGYQVIDRIDDTHVLIAVEPGADMLNRIKTSISELNEANAKQDKRIEALEQSGGTGGTTTVVQSSARMTIAHYVGQLFNKPEGRAYVGWPLGNVAYDPNDDTVNILVNVADTHDMTNDENRPDLYLCKMNPQTLECTLSPIVYDEAVVNQTNADEVTWAAGTKGAYTYGLCIDSNGDYLFMPNYCGVAYLFRSSDHGASWAVTVCDMSNLNDHAFTGLMQTSTGRLIVSTHSSYFWYSDDDGATWTKCDTPTTHTYGHEACIAELKENELIAVMRKRWSATSTGDYQGTPEIDPAFICYSHDNGKTWTNGVVSTTITEMSGSGAAIAMLDDGMVELYATSRYPHGDAVGVIYRHRASIEDALDDKWSSGKVVRYSNAKTGSDFGYPGCCVDSVGNTHLFYYDGDAETSGSANYYYIQSYSEINNIPINSDSLSAINPSIPYSASKVAMMIAAASAKLQAQIDKLIIQGGGTPEDSGTLDGSSPIYDGLFEWFDYLDESTYAADIRTYTGLYGKCTMVCTTTSGLGYEFDSRGLVQAGSCTDISTAGIQYKDGVTIETEYLVESTPVNANIINTGDYSPRIVYNGQIIYTYTNSSGDLSTYYGDSLYNDFKELGIHHVIITFNDESVKLYVDGNFKGEVVYAETSGGAIEATELSRVGNLGLWGDYMVFGRCLRVYSRELTADEVKNNYLYCVGLREA